MKIHYIIHAQFEKLGAIREWAEQRGHSLSGTNTFLGESLPEQHEYDFLIIMGGPQSARELDKYPYLQREVNMIQEAIQSKKYVLGICLGAQLISLALDAKPEASPYKEVGMFPISFTKHADSDAHFSAFPQQFMAMHWHGDMPGLTQHAQVIAKSDGCPRQIICYNPRTYGFQCHLELTPITTQGIIDSCPQDLTTGTYIQSIEQIMQSDFTTANNYLKQFLDRFIA